MSIGSTRDRLETIAVMARELGTLRVSLGCVSRETYMAWLDKLPEALVSATVYHRDGEPDYVIENFDARVHDVVLHAQVYPSRLATAEESALAVSERAVVQRSEFSACDLGRAA
jgi:hypothetical protein